ncbi:transposase [Cerasicoccus maritimus]
MLMPDHLHALITFSPSVKMAQLIARFKSFQARQLQIKW